VELQQLEMIWFREEILEMSERCVVFQSRGDEASPTVTQTTVIKTKKKRREVRSLQYGVEK
jgi:hypothetical protein